MRNQIIWIFWLIIYILIFVAYDREPLKYSNKKIFNIISTILIPSFSNLYKFLTIIVLILHIIYGIYLTNNFPFSPYIKTSMNIAPFLVGLIVIYSLNKTPIKDHDPKKFYLAPNNLNKNLGIIYILLIIIPICLKLVTMYYKSNGIESYICIGLSIIYLIKKIINNNYTACLYNLPKTFI